MGHRRRSEIGGCQSKTATQNNNEPPCPRKFLTQPTEFEKSGVLQHPLASFCSESQNNRIKTGVRAFFQVDFFILFQFFS
jgi:hypothetical protein